MPSIFLFNCDFCSDVMHEHVLFLAAYHETLIQVYIHTDQVDIPELCHFLHSYYGDLF